MTLRQRLMQDLEPHTGTAREARDRYMAGRPISDHHAAQLACAVLNAYNTAVHYESLVDAFKEAERADQQQAEG